MKSDKTVFTEKLKESLYSVLPVTAIVFLLCFTIVPVPNDILAAFIVGAILLIAGMGFFTLGTELSMTPVGEFVGSAITKSRKLWFVALISFVVGIIITVAEPDLQVLAEQVPNLPNLVIILSVALGVGIFLVVAMLRILFAIPLKYLLIGFYAIVFTLSFFVPAEFIAVSFDSGGVTTGPMTVPFILALGVGAAAIRTDRNAEQDSFGLVALCSVGPILSVMIIGLLFPVTAEAGAAVQNTPLSFETSRELWQHFAATFPANATEVALALSPIVLFFVIFQLAVLKLKKSAVIRISVGLVYTYIGLVLFLTGVGAGFMPMGDYLGKQLGALDYNWIIIPVGMLIGYFIVAAEPAVHVLNSQVFRLTSGLIPQKALSIGLSIGVSVSIGLSMLRLLLGIPILWLLIPGYAIAIVLSFISPPMFTAIAFDSGGVASGPMTATFLLPLAAGVCSAIGGDPVTDAFGVVAMVAMTPLIAIQILGVVFRIKSKAALRGKVSDTAEEVIELEDDI